MRRIKFGALLTLLLAGCMDMADKKEPTLDSKQRKAWNSKRKEVADSPYIIVGYDADENDWLTCVYTDPKLVRYDWRKTIIDIWAKEDMDTYVRVLAKKKAEDESGRIAAVAIVDLLSDDDPKVMTWYFMEEGRLKARPGHSGPPRPDLGVSLKKYLFYIQCNPAIVKKID